MFAIHSQRLSGRPTEGSSNAEEQPAPSEWEDFMAFISLIKEWAARWIRTMSKIIREGIREDVLAYRDKLKERSLARLQHREEDIFRVGPGRSSRARVSASAGSSVAAVTGTAP